MKDVGTLLSQIARGGKFVLLPGHAVPKRALEIVFTNITCPRCGASNELRISEGEAWYKCRKCGWWDHHLYNYRKH